MQETHVPPLVPRTFALTGVAGFVASRHLDAIARNGGRLVAAYDPHDAAGILDASDLQLPFFTDAAEFERYLSAPPALDFLSVCAPNDVHVAHCRMGLGLGADVICEKPVVVEPRDLDELARLEERTGRRVWTVLQLRFDARLEALRADVGRRAPGARAVVQMTYIAARGPWYDRSWKGDEHRSGGIATNIGVHMFDLLLWIFGAPLRSVVHLRERRRLAGSLELERASVRWFLSVEPGDLARANAAPGQRALRELVVDGEPIDFASTTSLHDRVYERTLRGEGAGLDDARASIELAARIRQATVVDARSERHPLEPR